MDGDGMGQLHGTVPLTTRYPVTILPTGYPSFHCPMIVVEKEWIKGELNLQTNLSTNTFSTWKVHLQWDIMNPWYRCCKLLLTGDVLSGCRGETAAHRCSNRGAHRAEMVDGWATLNQRWTGSVDESGAVEVLKFWNLFFPLLFATFSGKSVMPVMWCNWVNFALFSPTGKKWSRIFDGKFLACS